MTISGDPGAAYAAERKRWITAWPETEGTPGRNEVPRPTGRACTLSNEQFPNAIPDSHDEISDIPHRIGRWRARVPRGRSAHWRCGPGAARGVLRRRGNISERRRHRVRRAVVHRGRQSDQDDGMAAVWLRGKF